MSSQAPAPMSLTADCLFMVVNSLQKCMNTENERIRLAKNDPKNLATGVQDVAKLYQALEEKGYPQSLLEDIFWNNWRRIL